MTSKKKASWPKVRHRWSLNPKTRVEPSGKIYKRSRVPKKPTWVSQVDWFGGEP